MRYVGARRLLATLVVAFLAVSCTPEPPPDDAPTEQGTPSAAAAAADLRLSLESAFGRQAHLIIEAAAPNTQRAAGASTALTRNNQRMASTIAATYDRAAADEFTDIMRAYSTGFAEEAAAEQPTDDLTAFLSDLTDSGLDRNKARQLVGAATTELDNATAAHAERDYEAAYVAQRRAFAHMIEVARAFAAGISEHQELGGPRSTPLLELRSALRQFLGEHALLTFSVTRAGAIGARDFRAAAAALNGNTDDLVAALRSSYGTAVEPFAQAWRRRISSLADYTVATARDDDAAREDARRALRRRDGAVAAAIDALTDGAASRRAMREALTPLTTALVRQVDAVTKDRRKRAQAAQAQAFQRSLAVADVLAAGIAANRPEEYADR